MTSNKPERWKIAFQILLIVFGIFIITLMILGSWFEDRAYERGYEEAQRDDISLADSITLEVGLPLQQDCRDDLRFTMIAGARETRVNWRCVDGKVFLIPNFMDLARQGMNVSFYEYYLNDDDERIAGLTVDWFEVRKRIHFQAEANS